MTIEHGANMYSSGWNTDSCLAVGVDMAIGPTGRDVPEELFRCAAENRKTAGGYAFYGQFMKVLHPDGAEPVTLHAGGEGYTLDFARTFLLEFAEDERKEWNEILAAAHAAKLIVLITAGLNHVEGLRPLAKSNWWMPAAFIKSGQYDPSQHTNAWFEDFETGMRGSSAETVWEVYSRADENGVRKLWFFSARTGR